MQRFIIVITSYINKGEAMSKRVVMAVYRGLLRYCKVISPILIVVVWLPLWNRCTVSTIKAYRKAYRHLILILQI